MKQFPAGLEFSTLIPFVTSEGVPFSASSGTFKVLDEFDFEVVPATALTLGAGSSEATVTLGDRDTTLAVTLPVGRTQSVFTIRLALINDEGGATIFVEDHYLLVAAQVLVPGVNTQMTYAQSLMLSINTADLEGWSAASRAEREAALISAWSSFTRIRFDETIWEDYEMDRIIDPLFYTGIDVTEMTAEQFEAMPPKFKNAVRLAHLIEADFLLGGNQVERTRRAGLMSTTVGEASQFFRTVKPYIGPLCDRALRALTPYLARTIRVNRG
jgi:hypothetical protein